jgi:hypothetical protein
MTHPALSDTAAINPEAPFEEIFAAMAERLDGRHPELNRRLAFNLGEEGVYHLVVEEGRARIHRGDNPQGDSTSRADATIRIKPKDARKLLTVD